MPPQTRRSKTAKACKENIGVISRTKLKTTQVTKQRKALADKTNSASDENSSTEFTKKKSRPTSKHNVNKVKLEVQSRPRRERKLPNRYNENELLTNLSNNKDIDSDQNETIMKITNKSLPNTSSPSKTPQKKADNSIIFTRPKRVCRLPSKFNDNLVSPDKFIPVSCHASTPIVHNKKPNLVSTIDKKSETPVKETKLNTFSIKKTPQKNENRVVTSPKLSTLSDIVLPLKETKNTKMCYNKSPEKDKNVITAANIIPDTNNNAKNRQLRRRKVVNENEVLPVLEKVSPDSKIYKGKRVLRKSSSFCVLEDKKKTSKRDNSHLDIYEFTYDPNEEPPPQKKKRKKAVKKNPSEPKVLRLKNNYDKNISKALEALKNVVLKKIEVSKMNKPVESQNKQQPINIISTTIQPTVPTITVTSAIVERATEVLCENNIQVPTSNTSIRVENIEADFEPVVDYNDINYSPVTSPHHKSPARTDEAVQQHENTNDPLNLQDSLGFFDDVPVASSSMNTSVKRPHASPWRVQFEELPIKWQVNTYIKPNMTPAVESSFINFNDSNRKKHVYTNLVAESNDDLPEIVTNDRPNLKQTSIISFIKEVVERSASKKKRAASVTPTKANSVFEDGSAVSIVKTPNKTPGRAGNYWTPCKIQEDSALNSAIRDKENSRSSGSSKKKCQTTNQTPESLKLGNDGTFFGFDESEDQENVSPVKIANPRVRALRPRARAVLHELNAQPGPTRAKIPLAAKSNVVASSDAVNKVYEGMKSATDAPVFPDKTTTIMNDNANLDDEDSQSIHLFEDIELVHHIKPSRKSYGKAKKVTFQQTVPPDSDSQSTDTAPQEKDNDDSCEEDDLADLTFTMPNVASKNITKKKTTKKKKELSKKEKAEMEAWAAQFNSMCEDVEEFPLVVE